MTSPVFAIIAQPPRLLAIEIAGHVRKAGGSCGPTAVERLAEHWRKWTSFCCRINATVLPIKTQDLRAYILESAACGLSLREMKRALETLCLVHQFAGLADPITSADAAAMWEELERRHFSATEPKSAALQTSEQSQGAQLAAPAATASAEPLDPNRLDEAAIAAVERLVEIGTPENTRRSYDAALAYWDGWFEARYQRELTYPVPLDVLVQFLLDHAQTEKDQRTWQLPAEIDAALVAAKLKKKAGPLKMSTVLHRFAALSKAHQTRGFTFDKNPCADRTLQETLQLARKAARSEGVDKPSRPTEARASQMELMLKTCDETLPGMRDRAILLVGFSSGGRRRAELAQLHFSNLKAFADPDRFEIQLGVTKRNQEGDPERSPAKPIEGRAAAALRDWIRAAQITDGPVFRRLFRVPGEKRWKVGERLSDRAIWDIVRSRADLAAARSPPDERSAFTRISPHSLRSGFVSEAIDQGVPIGDVMTMTDHKSIRTLQRYIRARDLRHSPASRLLDKKPSG